MFYLSRNPGINLKSIFGSQIRILDTNSICRFVPLEVSQGLVLLFTHEKGTSAINRGHICIHIPRTRSRTPAVASMGSIETYGIGGDFNAVHPEWQPLAIRLHGDGQVLIDWMHEHDMDLSSSSGVPNHDHGNMLDLVWSNAGALADVSIGLDSTSDHHTIAGDFPRPNSKGSIFMKVS